MKRKIMDLDLEIPEEAISIFSEIAFSEATPVFLKHLAALEKSNADIKNIEDLEINSLNKIAADLFTEAKKKSINYYLVFKYVYEKYERSLDTEKSSDKIKDLMAKLLLVKYSQLILLARPLEEIQHMSQPAQLMEKHLRKAVEDEITFIIYNDANDWAVTLDSFNNKVIEFGYSLTDLKKATKELTIPYHDQLADIIELVEMGSDYNENFIDLIFDW